MTLKLVVIDMDETLLRPNKTYDQARFNRVLQQLVELDVVVCIASGNSYHKLEEYFTPETIEQLYFAGDNGNYIIRNNTLLEETALPYDVSQKILEFITEFDGFYPVISTGRNSYFKNTNEEFYQYILTYNNVLTEITDYRDIPSTELAVKLAVVSDHSLEHNKTMVRIINERYEEAHAVTSGEKWLDVYAAQGGKGSAVRYLQNKYHIDPTECIAFGDSLNDLSMMNEVHYSVAMGNADHDLSMWCRYQIGTNEDQAVIDVLEQYLEQNTLDFMEQYRRMN